MRRSDEVMSWVPPLIGYGVWFVLLVVFRSVVLSMRGVQTAGFAVPPFRSELYIFGLPWITLIDAAFRTLILISVLSFGGRVRDLISSTFSRLARLGNLAYLGSIAGAVAIGYYAYALIVVPPLLSQGVEWAYALVFGVAMAGIGAAGLYEIVRLLMEVTQQPVAAEPSRPIAPAQPERAVPDTCPTCGQGVGRDDVFCRACGTRIREPDEA